MHDPAPVAVLGFGAMGEVMAKAFGRDPGWEVALVSDPAAGAAERAERLAPGAHFEADAAAALEPRLLDRLGVELVAIAAPPASHEPLALAALDAGRHVLCEKPMALDGDAAARMAAAAAARPELIAVIDHQLRFTRSRSWLRDRLRAGDLGRVSHADVRIDVPRIYGSGWTWWSSRALGGGVLNEFGSHSVDLLGWLFGAHPSRARGSLRTVVATRADADGVERAVDSDDLAALLLEWEDGRLAEISVSGLALPADRYLRVHGENGSVEITADDLVLWRRRGGDTRTFDLRETEPSLIGDPNETYTQPFARLVAALRESLRTGVAPADAASFADGLAVTRTLDAVRASAGTPDMEDRPNR